MATHRQIVLAAKPAGMPKESDFELVENPIPTPKPGEFVVRNEYLSVDPYMRGRMRGVDTYTPAFRMREPMAGGAVGRVVESRHPEYAVGDVVVTMQGWREYGVSDGGDARKVDALVVPLSAYLGVLGMPGFTAWYGLHRIGEPKRGETLVVSAAAGAVGSLVGQLGKRAGCRVVGTVGSAAKADHLTGALGFDAAIDYRACGDLTAALRDACPGGIDIYFENVGGAMLEAVLTCANVGARIAVCGMVSQYNLDVPDPGPRNLFELITKRILMQGFLIRDHGNLLPEFVGEVGPLVGEGAIRYRETIVDGIENAPRAFIELLSGGNVGKMLVRLPVA